MPYRRRLQRAATAWLLVAVLVLAVAIPAAAPAEAKRGGAGIPPGLAKKLPVIPVIFRDLDDAPWATKFIQAMWRLSIVRGYEDGRFLPNKPVTRIEALVMVVRALGLEEDAREAADEDLPYNDIPAWARGYVAVAIEKGILEPGRDGEDGRKFRSNQPATRAWVAALLARAAESGLDENLSEELTFADADEIPTELQAYVRLAVELGWFRGYPGNFFKPNKPITRAEMAAVLDRFLDYDGLETKLSGYLRGTIVDLDADGLTLRVRGGATVSFDFADEVMVFIDDKAAETSDLRTGMRVSVRVVSGAIVFVDAFSPKDDDRDDEDEDRDEADDEFEVSGRIQALDTSGTWHITVNGKTYRVDADVEVKSAAGKKMAFADLRVGWRVRLEGERRDGQLVVTEIRVEEKASVKRVSATLYAIAGDGDEYELEVVTADGDREELTVDEDDVRVYHKDGGTETEVGLKGLSAGDGIVLIYEGDALVAIEIRSLGRDEQGVVVELDLQGSQRSVTIDRDLDADKVDLETYSLADVVDVSSTVASVKVDALGDVRSGDQVTLTLTADDEVIRVVVTARSK